MGPNPPTQVFCKNQGYFMAFFFPGQGGVILFYPGGGSGGRLGKCMIVNPNFYFWLQGGGGFLMGVVCHKRGPKSGQFGWHEAHFFFVSFEKKPGLVSPQQHEVGYFKNLVSRKLGVSPPTTPGFFFFFPTHKKGGGRNCFFLFVEFFYLAFFHSFKPRVFSTPQRKRKGISVLVVGVGGGGFCCFTGGGVLGLLVTTPRVGAPPPPPQAGGEGGFNPLFPAFFLGVGGSLGSLLFLPPTKNKT